MVDDALIEKDYEYIHGLMPDSFRRLFDLIEDICDRLEYKGSFLFDECPDKTTILNLTDKIYSQIGERDKNELAPDSSTPVPLKNFIQSLLLNEILFRRCRFYHKTKRFQ